MQNFLCDKLPWELLLEKYENIYANKLIFDWNICDWFCVRVLSPTIIENGERCAKKVTSWKNADYVWQVRSAVVPFVNLASEAQYYPYVMGACKVLISREERFSKTAVGWVLREISKYEEQMVFSFIDNHLKSFSRESLGNALKYLDERRKKEYLHQVSKAK